MAIVAPQRSTTRRRTVAYSVGAGIAVLLLVAGLAFVNSTSVTRVTDNARSLHWLNATVGTGALARAGLAQAVTFAELEESGDVDPADLDFAFEQLREASDQMGALVEAGGDLGSAPEVARFTAALERAIILFEQGDVGGAKDLATTEVETTYRAMSELVRADQRSIEAAIDDNTEAGRTLNGWIVFVLTLLVPGSAVFAYFVIARRQVRAFQAKATLEVEAERKIGRAKDAFIAGLSHELRTPLTSIYGFAEVLSDGGIAGAEATQETGQVIAIEAAEMTRMVDDLLVASRLESTGVAIEVKPTAIDPIVESAVAPYARAGIEVAREPSLAKANVDGARLRQVLVNLLSNASRHGGSRIGVDVTTGVECVDIEVWDDGPGVSEEKVAGMFERFVHQGDAPLLTGSVGLGLAVASRLTQLMDGSLQYQRYNGRTYFIVTLPLGVIRGEEDDNTSVADMIRVLSS